MHADAFAQVAEVILIATVLGALGVALRQPLIVSAIGAGILIGPTGLGLVVSAEPLALPGEIGIALLLFVVGLKLDLQTIRTLGPVVTLVGIGQIAITGVAAAALLLAMGFPPLHVLYLAAGLTLSSTIIVVKLLSDRREIDALHGRIALGILILQDIGVVGLMIVITALGAVSPDRAGFSLWSAAGLVALKGAGLVLFVGLLARWVLTPTAGWLARVPELLVLASIAWAVGLAALNDWLGFGKEVGAFVGGVALASTPYREAIASRLVSVRDFLLLFFFIELGVGFDFANVGRAIGDAIVLCAFVLLVKPVIVTGIVGTLGYRRRTAFLSGIAVGQISEFSLILGSLGLSMGHLDERATGILTFVALVAFTLSPYPVVYANRLYERLAPLLGVFERRHPFREIADDAPADREAADVVLFGIGRYGSGIARHLRQRRKRVLGVDFDPSVVREWTNRGVPVVYGDAEDPEIYEHLPLDGVGWVVSTAPEPDASRLLIQQLRRHGFAGRIAVTGRTAEEAAALQAAGADVVLRPFADAAEQAADVITSAMEHVAGVAGQAPGLREARVPPGSIWEGRTIESTRMRERFSVSVLAVSRGGRSFVNPDPQLQLFPGDRLVLLGEPASLDAAIREMGRVVLEEDSGGVDFAVREIAVRDTPTSWHGRTLAALDLRNRYAVTVIGVRREDGRVVAATAAEELDPASRLIVAGTSSDLDAFQSALPSAVAQTE